MLTPGKGKIGARIAQRLKEEREGKADKDERDDGEYASSEGRVSAMEDFITAVKRGDAEAADEALCDWACLHDGEKE